MTGGYAEACGRDVFGIDDEAQHIINGSKYFINVTNFNANMYVATIKGTL